MVLKALLLPFETGYKSLWVLWDWAYRSRIFPIHKVRPKVISVGNLTWGGTGKTPLVEYLARGLSERGEKLAVLSRGYGSRSDRFEADEVRWFAERLDGVPIFAQPDRVASAKQAERRGMEVLILDDGFQHRRLARQLDIVTIDTTSPFGNRHLIPRGNLREPLEGLGRADWIVLTRVDMANGNLERVKEEIRQYAPRAKIAKAIHAPVSLRKVEGRRSKVEGKTKDFNFPSTFHLPPSTFPPAWLQGKRIGALAAIGNPWAFQKTLENLGARVEMSQFRRDHSSYDARDLEFLLDQQEKQNLTGWVTTSKDLIKLSPLLDSKPDLAMWVLEVAFQFIEGEKELWQAIESLGS